MTKFCEGCYGCVETCGREDEIDKEMDTWLEDNADLMDDLADLEARIKRLEQKTKELEDE